MPRPNYPCSRACSHLVCKQTLKLISRFGLTISLLALLLMTVAAHAAAQTGQPPAKVPDSAKHEDDVRVLEPDKPIEREMAGGEIHSYRIMLATGQYMHVTVEQRGIDVAVALRGPDGGQLAEMSGLNGMSGMEELSWEAARSGEYALEVRAREKQANAGCYEAKLQKTAGASDKERARIAAERLYMEGARALEEQSGEALERAVNKYEEAVGKWREAGDKKWSGLTLGELGIAYAHLGQNEKARSNFEQALTVWRESKDRGREGNMLNSLGIVHADLSQYEKARAYYEQALAIRREIKDRSGEGASLSNLGLVYRSIGQYEKARDNFEQALSIKRAIKDRLGEGNVLNNLAGVYIALGQQEKARDYLEQALAIRREIKDKRGEGATLGNLGVVYRHLSQYEKARDYYEQALVIMREIKDRLGEGKVLSNLGTVYVALGQQEKARDSFEQALVIAREIKYRSGEVVALGNLGVVYRHLSQYEKARDYYEQALVIARKIKDRLGEGAMLSNLGTVYRNLSQYEKARDYSEQSLVIMREIKDRNGEGEALGELGLTYVSLKQYEKARDYLEQSLAISREIKDKSGEGETLNDLMSLWKSLNKPRLAIFYGKQAVNTVQDIRSSIKGLEKESQKSFLKSKEDTYRKLADLLISEGRLPEAQQVLALLKEAEYFDFVRRDSKEASALNGRADLTPEEAEWAKRYQEIADQVAEVGRKRGELLAKKERTAEEEKQMATFEADLQVASHAFQKFLDQLAEELAGAKQGGEKVFQLRESQGLMADLRELGAGVVALYTVVGEERYRVILVTPDVQKAYEYPIKAADLYRKVFAFREVLQDPKRDPRPLAQELYRIVVGPVAKDLQAAHAETLMWSLDSVLRYIPIAALHDGKQYMVERYRNEIFTPASMARLKDAPTTGWTGLGLGVSKAQVGFSALPAVVEELRGIIREESAGNGAGGVLPGKLMLNEAFTAASMQTGLRQHYPVVHIASHFQFRPGNETDSFLLLGDGTHLSLAELKTMPGIFGGVELLTLSACDTATGGAGADGKEIDGFGMLAQRQGAKSVVASLWPVADASTRLLMQRFYRSRNEQGGMLKAEALRQAQLALLRGVEKATTANEAGRGMGADMPGGFPRDPNAPYAHPFFWAPFILIGNWR